MVASTRAACSLRSIDVGTTARPKGQLDAVQRRSGAGDRAGKRGIWALADIGRAAGWSMLCASVEGVDEASYWLFIQYWRHREHGGPAGGEGANRLAPQTMAVCGRTSKRGKKKVTSLTAVIASIYFNEINDLAIVRLLQVIQRGVTASTHANRIF